MFKRIVKRKIVHRMISLLSKKKVPFLISFIGLFLLIFSFSGCRKFTNEKSVNQDGEQLISRDEKQWLEKFFNDLLLGNTGIYTLCGSKPMTEFEMHHYSENELLQMIEDLSDDEKKGLIISYDYNLPENWEKWEKIRSRFQIGKFLFFKMKTEDPKIDLIYLVNIPKISMVFEENYSGFCKTLGHEFDIMNFVLTLEDPASEFWTKCMNDIFLRGILFGYGKENSILYQWEFQSRKSENPQFKKFREYLISKRGPSIDHYKYANKTSLKDFPIPTFISFQGNNDGTIRQYEKERKKIKETYKGKNFVEFTLKLLTD